MSYLTLTRSSKLILFHFLAVSILSTSTACAAQSKSSVFHKGQNLIIENFDLSAKQFLDAIRHGSIEDRRYAEMYLLGTIDAAEGESWCDYKTIKTITIDERLYSEMISLPPNALSQRAAKVIKSILAKEFPCRR